MVDILIYMYENFFGSGIYPAHEDLQLRLFAAGFHAPEVKETLAWLEHVHHEGSTPPPLGKSTLASRFLDPAELERIGQDGWEFLAFLENNCILSASQREMILTGVLTLTEPEMDLDQLKLMVLMALWRQGDTMNALMVEELIHYQDWMLQ